MNQVSYIMQNIIFLMPSLKTGGGNRVTLELSNQLINKGYQVKVIYPNNSMDLHTFTISDSVEFVKIGNYADNKKDKLVNLFKTIQHINNHHKDDIVIVSDPIISLFTNLLRVTVVYRYVQVDDYRIFDDLFILKNKFILNIYKNLTKRSYQANIRYLFNSLDTYNHFLQVSKRKDIPLNLVHPAIDHHVFFNQGIRQKQQTNLCIVARKHPWKGFKEFIEAYNQGKLLGIDNVYVISHDDLSDFDLSNVTLVRPKNDQEIAYYMNLSQIFVSTSWFEGFGLPPLEAMACGCACLISDSGGVNEYAKDGYNCLMYQPQNILQMIKQLDLLVNNSELRDRLVGNGLQTVKRFDWKISVTQLINIVE